MSGLAGEVLVWWLTAQLFTIVGWPAAVRLFGHLPGMAFALARPLGLLLTGFTADCYLPARHWCERLVLVMARHATPLTATQCSDKR